METSRATLSRVFDSLGSELALDILFFLSRQTKPATLDLIESAVMTDLTEHGAVTGTLLRLAGVGRVVYAEGDNYSLSPLGENLISTILLFQKMVGDMEDEEEAADLALRIPEQLRSRVIAHLQDLAERIEGQESTSEPQGH